MPIRINLLAEALADEDLRRRDPVKRAIYGGAFFVALSLVWYSSSLLEFMMDKEHLSQIQGRIQLHTNDYAQVKSNLKKIDEAQMRLDALDQLSAARFLQGNLLNALQRTCVPNVQLTQVRVNQNYVLTAAVPAKKTDHGTTPAQPASAVEQVTLTIDAKDFSQNAGEAIPNYKDVLIKHQYFAPSIGTNGIRLAGLSPQQMPLDGKPFVTFSLECRFADRP